MIVSARDKTRRAFDTIRRDTGHSFAHIRASLGLFAGILYATSALPGFAAAVAPQDGAPTPKLNTAVLNTLQDAFAQVADELEPAVVTISSFKAIHPSQGGSSGDFPRGLAPFGTLPRHTTGTGSGVIISKDGWVLTNDHVVGGADRVTVKLHDGREFVGTVRRDYRSDIALIKIAASAALPTARLGDSDKLRIGYWAIAIGSPYKYEGSFSVGVISSLFRQQSIQDYNSPVGGRFYPNMIQTDAAINPGNSGGPLCNLTGEVIGINTAIESEGGGSVGIGFAIPVNLAKFVIGQLLEKGKVSYGYLGVSPTTVTPRLASALKVDQGALIESEPDPGSPAAKAGLEVGDVVVGIGAKPVLNELDLRTMIAQTAPGTTVDLHVIHDGAKKVLKAVLTEAQVYDPDKPHLSDSSKLGIEVQPLTDKLAEQAKAPLKTAGVVIKSIALDGAAAQIDDLVEGSIILKVNDSDTPTVQAYRAAVANIKSGDKVKMVYLRDRTKRFVVIVID